MVATASTNWFWKTYCSLSRGARVADGRSEERLQLTERGAGPRTSTRLSRPQARLTTGSSRRRLRRRDHRCQTAARGSEGACHRALSLG